MRRTIDDDYLLNDNEKTISSYSCGYRKAFEEYSNIIFEKYPDIRVQGSNYDPPGKIIVMKLQNYHLVTVDFISSF